MLPDGIVSLPMTPMPRTSLLMTWVYTLIVLVLFLPGIVELLMFRSWAFHTLGYFLLVIMTTVLLILWITTGVGRYWATRVTDHEFKASRWGTLLLILQRARLPIRHAGPAATIGAVQHLRDDCAESEIECPRTIIDLRFASSIASIDLESNMVEPEPIYAGPARRNRDRIRALIGGALFILIGLLFESMFCLITGAAALVIPLISLQIVRRHSSSLRGGLHRLVAGQGFIRSLKGGVWTSEDSVCIVRSTNRRTRSDDACIVMLYGPDGTRRIPFPSTLDPYFISFWTRWNHPDPRPTLARQSSVTSD